MYSSLVNMPVYDGSSDFIAGGGILMHSSKFDDKAAEKVVNQNVVIVGSAKSAQDIAVASLLLGRAKTTTLLFRNFHWGTPTMIAGHLNRLFMLTSV